MSSEKEIAEVYSEDIYRQSKAVESKFGISPFYDNFDGFGFCAIYENTGVEKIRCSEFFPRTKKWSKKYCKSFGEMA